MIEHVSYKKISYKGYAIIIDQDEFAESPREWDNLGTMVCFHKRYNLGDKHDLHSEDFSGWEEMGEYLKSKDAVVLPLYLYDHSGITMSTSHGYPYNDRWDAGQVGFIYVSRDRIKKEFKDGLDDEGIAARLMQEVKTYDDYLRDYIFGFVTIDKNGDEIDSCSGYIGNDFEKSGLLDEARSSIDYDCQRIADRRLSWSWQHAFC